MSLKQGNIYAQQDKYELAVQEWKKVARDNPMYQFAQQNIERVVRLGLAKGDDEQPITQPTTQSVTQQIKSSMVEVESKQLPKSSDGNPLLSIVMPVYNVAPYLDASILSVLSQSLTDFELIIVNDASTDNSKTIIEMFAKEDERVKVINLEFNTLGGAGIPSNVGIKAARGKYLGFVDSDDFIVRDAFETLVNLAEKYDAETVIGDFVTFDENTRTVKTAYDQGKWNGMPIEQITNVEKHPLLFHLAPVPWRKLYRMDFMKKHNILYPEVDYFYEDNPLHWSVLSKATKVVVTKKRISYHRMGRQGQTMGSDKYKLSSICAHLNSFFKMAQKDPRPVIFDEFYDQWHRTDWVADSQTKDSFEQKIIKKRLANMFHRATQIQPLRTKRTTFPARIAEYTNAYPDMDLNIVISTAHGDSTIKKCLDAILKISEIKCNALIVDNQLDVELSKKLVEYQKNNPYVHIVQQKYRGLGRSRNTLLPMCTGKYVLFLNDYSIIEPKTILKAYRQALQNNNDLLIFKTQIDYLDGEKLLSSKINDEKLWQTNSGNKELALKLQPSIDSKLVKTEFLHDNDLFFGGSKYFDDIIFHWKGIIVANSVGFLAEIGCKQHQPSTKKTIPDSEGLEYKSLFNELTILKQLLLEKDDQKLNLFKEFAQILIKSVEDNSPLDCQSDFAKRKNEILK